MAGLFITTPLILSVVLLPQRSLGQPSVPLNTWTFPSNRENVHLDVPEKMEVGFEDLFRLPKVDEENVEDMDIDNDTGSQIKGKKDDLDVSSSLGKVDEENVEDMDIDNDTGSRIKGKKDDLDVSSSLGKGYSDHESEDETRLPQPIFDPDLRSVRHLPVEITANTSQDHSNSPPAVISDHQVTQWEDNEDSLSSLPVSLLYDGAISLVWDEEDSDDDPRGISKENGTATRTLSEILQQFQDKISADQICLIEVRRSAIWVNTCDQLMHKRFSPNNRISVKFVDNEGKSEGAVDVGGPTREFLRLVVKAANEDSDIFIGPAGCRSLFPNNKALEEDLYRLVGVVLAWSLAHGGPAGNFFSGTLYDSIAYGPGKRPPKLEDIADEVLKQKIIKIADSKTDKELEKNLHDDEIQRILDARGAVKLPVLKNKDSIVNIILRHVLVDSTRYLLEALKEGLETLGVLEAIKKHPEQFRELFTRENIRPLDFATVDAIFHIDYDEQGSNERAVQDLTIFHWRIYLQECESGDAGATLGDVLSFATGADVPPVLGFDQTPVITFQDMRFPTASTCAPTLRLPTKFKTYKEFKENMDSGILNSSGFGHA